MHAGFACATSFVLAFLHILNAAHGIFDTCSSVLHRLRALPIAPGNSASSRPRLYAHRSNPEHESLHFGHIEKVRVLLADFPTVSSTFAHHFSYFLNSSLPVVPLSSLRQILHFTLSWRPGPGREGGATIPHMSL